MKHLFTLSLLLSFCHFVSLADAPFAPGAGGSLPTFTEFQPIEGKVGGFLVNSSIRRNNWFGTGTNAEVNMSFPNAASYGAESLVLQYKNGETWTNYLSNDQEVTTTGDNFSLTVYQTYTFRLLLRGGSKNGYVSNEQTAALSTVDTYFSGVSMDESMYITGVMSPWVGRGLQVSYVVKKLSDNTEVPGGLTVQWYRVNPVTYASTPIPGADSLTYRTTSADLGYKILAKATGNETTVGGFYQMMAGMGVVSPNKCYVSNPSTTGFTLMLYQDLPKLDTGELFLRDKDWNKVPITSVVKGAANGVFRINANLSENKNPYYLQNTSSFWRICTEMVFGPMHDLMEGVNIDITASALKPATEKARLNVLYEAAGNQIRFQSTSMIESVRLYNLAGVQLGNWEPNQTEGQLPAAGLKPGMYVLRFSCIEGQWTRKVMVTK